MKTDPVIFILDTCVMSEMLRRRPAQSVIAWLDRFFADCRLTTPVYMEMEQGIALVQDADLRNDYRMRSDRLVDRFSSDQWLLFDRAAAREAAAAIASAQRAGRPLAAIDAQIVGLAIAMRCAVATRDADFEDRGVELVNPWKDEA